MKMQKSTVCCNSELKTRILKKKRNRKENFWRNAHKNAESSA